MERDRVPPLQERLALGLQAGQHRLRRNLAAGDDVIVLVRGGLVAEPVDAEYVLRKTTGVHGFYGAS